ncbi:MAG TPA: nitrilase-related carbon-nitrogen hydrolase [Candidatus Sulfotelmatobacter sp.]|nr:nitrilase-related carbon-nitrogen hydrolase [Candidatus Sulfotelmatobacter sp.]
MDSKPNASYLAAPCLAISAALFFLGTGLTPLWPLTWLAAIPLLWIAPRVSGRQAYFVAAAAYGLGQLNEWSYSRRVLPTFVVASVLLLAACVFALGVLLFRSCMLRRKLWQAALVFPLFWVTVEFAVAMLSVHGTFGNISYSQMDFLPILQIASVTGIWGISFCILLFASTIAAVLDSGPISARIPVAVGTFLFLAIVLGFGFWRLAATPKNSPTIKTALVASDAPENINAETPVGAAPIFQRYADYMRPLAQQGVQLFVLPEHSGPITNASQADADAFWGQLAKQTGAFIAIGIDRIEPNVSWNQVRLYAPNGEFVGSYNKHHLLPHWEDQFAPDVKRTVLSMPSGKWGMEICKDMDFPRLSRQYSEDGIGLLIVPAWDFVDDGWLHGRMAILRGVESGFSIARSAKLGILTATDDRGRVLAQRDTLGPTFASVIVEVPVRHDATLYSRFGNWFAWLCVILFVLALVTAFRPAASAQ